MSWFSQFLGLDAASAQQDAINRQQEFSNQQYNNMYQNYTNALNNVTNATDQYSYAAQKERENLISQANKLTDWYNSAAQNEYQGALKDIYTQGRQQASQSGLIGGFQEGNNTAPQIAALGRSFATQQNDINRQNMMTRLSVSQYGSQLALSPLAQNAQLWGSMAQGALGAMSGAGNQYGQSLGNYSQGANPLGNIFGAIGGIAGGVGSLMSGLNGGRR